MSFGSSEGSLGLVIYLFLFVSDYEALGLEWI